MNHSSFDQIFKKLKAKNIIIDIETFKPYKNQGWMSSVFVADSNIGRLIIHLADLVDEHKRNKVWEKFSGLSLLFAAHPEIPTSKLHYVGLLNGKLLLVQNFIKGNQGGKRILKRGIISDVWNYNKPDTLKKILVALASIHSVRLRGFGWPVPKNGILNGKYKTWQDFLKAESARWIDVVKKTDEKLKNKQIINLKRSVEAIIDQIEYSGPSVLAHGDAINPGNIILKDNKEIALIDWEWSIDADPAWEFCYLGWWPWLDEKSLRPYLKAANINNKPKIEEFLKRINLYIPLWLLWGTYIHANDKHPEVYQALRQLLISKL